MKKNILILLYETDIFHCLKVAKELSRDFRINFHDDVMQTLKQFN